MWNRTEDEPGAGPSPSPASSSSGGRALLGPSIAMQGNLAGKEDLLIEGRFEGEIRVPGHQVTIGRQGNVEAEIRARRIVVEGKLAGNIVAEEQAVVRATGRVQGDIKSPKVALDEGCQFKGRIDMEPVDAKAEAASAGDAKPVEAKETTPASPGPKGADRGEERNETSPAGGDELRATRGPLASGPTGARPGSDRKTS